MSILEIFKSALKHKITIVGCILVCMLAGALASSKYGAARYDNSIFIDISVQDKFQKTSAYENLEASDHFAESIQGWIIDPSFQDAVQKSSNIILPIQAKKQEKNNLVISFKSSSTDIANNFASVIIQELQKRLQEYNNNSDLVIYANHQPLQSIFKDSQLILFLGLSALSGLVLGIFLSPIIFDLARKLRKN